MIAQEWGGRQLLDRPSDGLLGGPTVKFFRECVPEDHEPVGVRCHNCLLYGIEQLGLEPDRRLGARALRHIRHRSNHSDCSPDVVARDMAAIHHVGVSTIRPAVAILIAPARSALFQDSVKSGDDSFAIFRMDVIVPPLDLGENLGLLVAEDVLDRVVPGERVRSNVPVPNHVMSGSCHEAKALVC